MPCEWMCYAAIEAVNDLAGGESFIGEVARRCDKDA